MTGTLGEPIGDEPTIFPYLESRRIRLRPAVGAADGASFYEILLRLGLGSLPRQDRFVGAYDHSVNAHFAVCERRNEAVVGYTSLSDLDDQAGHVELGAVADRERAAPGVGAEAAFFTINYAFAMWNIAKVYIRTTQASIPFFGGTLAAMARREGVLTENTFFRGRLWDTYISAIHRTDWTRTGKPIVERLVCPPRKGSHA